MLIRITSVPEIDSHTCELSDFLEQLKGLETEATHSFYDTENLLPRFSENHNLRSKKVVQESHCLVIKLSELLGRNTHLETCLNSLIETGILTKKTELIISIKEGEGI